MTAKQEAGKTSAKRKTIRPKLLKPGESPTMEELINCEPLRNELGLLYKVPQRTLEAVRRSSVWATFGKGTILFRQGDLVKDTGVFVVTSGSVEVIHAPVSAGTMTTLVSVDGPGTALGEVELWLKGAIKDKSPRGLSYSVLQSTVRGASDGKVLWITLPGFITTVEDPQLLRNMIRMLAHKLLMRNVDLHRASLLGRNDNVLNICRAIGKLFRCGGKATILSKSTGQRAVWLPGCRGTLAKKAGVHRQQLQRCLDNQIKQMGCVLNRTEGRRAMVYLMSKDFFEHWCAGPLEPEGAKDTQAPEASSTGE